LLNIFASSFKVISMSLVVQIENLATGKVKKVNLKRGADSLKLPKGVHVEFVDKATGKTIVPHLAKRTGDDLILSLGDGDQAVELRMVDALQGASSTIPQGIVPLSMLGSALAPAPDASGAAAAAAAASSGGLGAVGWILGGLAIVGGAAAAAGSGSKASSTPAPTTPTPTPTPAPTTPTATAAPVVALGAGVGLVASATTATAAGGAVTVNAVSGASVTVNFTNGSHTVTKTATGTGAAQAVVLTAADLAALGDGQIAVSATATASGQSASSAATTSFTLDTVAPNAPALTLGAGVANGATAAEATAAGGVVSVLGESGSTIAVTFSDGTHTVTKSVTGTGAAQAVVLSAAELATLVDGTIAVRAVATDAAGNASAATTTSFALDTVAPNAPSLTLGAGVANGATAAEVTAAGGVVTVSGESGSAIAVTFSDGTHTVTKSVTGTGAAQAVVLTSADLATLSDGAIVVRAVSTDAAGNASTATTTSFTLDTIAPNAPALTLGAGVANGATAAEGTAAGGVVSVSGESGSTIAVTFSDGTHIVTKALTGTGAAQAVVLTAGELATLSDGSIVVRAVATDAAGNVSNAATTSFTLDTVAPAAPLLTLGAGVANGATAAEATAAGGVVTVSAEAGSAVVVTLTNGTDTIVRNLTGTGANQAITLSNLEMLTLGNSTVNVSATATDAAGNHSTAGTTQFVIDTVAPNGLQMTVPAGIVSGATAAELTGVSGAVKVIGEVGSTITVTFADALNAVVTKTVTGTGTFQAVSLTAAEAATLADGAINVVGTIRDSAGNAGASAYANFVLDTAAPTVSIGTIAVDDVINAVEHNSGLVISGATTAENGQVVTVGLNGHSYTGIANGGVWSVAVGASDVAALSNGSSYTVTANVADAAGNAATAATHGISVDTAAPSVAITSGALTSNATPVVSGTAEANANISVVIGGATYATTASAGGTWSVNTASATPASGTLSLNANGTNAVSVTATDAAGNPASVSQSLVIDTTAPSVAITSGTLTNNTHPVVSGTAEAGASVSVVIGGATYTTVATGGVWSVNTLTATPASGTLSLNANGSNTITATARDAAGNPTSTSQSLVVDTAAPTVSIGTIAVDDVINAVEHNSGLVISGATTAENGQVVTVGLNGHSYTGIANGGVWSVAVGASDVAALSNGSSYTVTANVADAAGNAATAATHGISVDILAPTAPVLTLGAGVAGGATASEAQAPVTVSAEAGSSVTVTFTDTLGTTITKTIANASGSGQALSLTSAEAASLADGAISVSAVATDAAGNVGHARMISFTLDTVAPNAPVFQAVSPDTGIAGDQIINTGNFDLTIAAASGSVVEVFGNGNVSEGFATETSTPGIYTLHLAGLGQGTNNFTAVATDAAGNASSVSSSFAVTVDTVAPNAPTLSLSHAVATGATAAAASDVAGVASVTAESGSTVTVLFTNTANNHTVTKSLTATGAAQAVTLLAADVAQLGDGAITVSAVATDVAGNGSAASSAGFALDTIAPAVAITSGALTNSATPVVSGTAEDGVSVSVAVGGATYTTVATGGVWSIDTSLGTTGQQTVGGTLSLNANGANAVSVTATDAAGNPASVSQSLVIDTTAPTLMIGTVAIDDVINAVEHGAGLVISGTTAGAANGQVVTVSLNGKSYAGTVIGASGANLSGGTWSVAIDASDVAALTDGRANYSVAANVADIAGNVATDSHTISVDTIAPAVAITSGGLTNLATPVVSGTAEAGASVSVTVGGATYATTASAGGTWSVDTATAALVSGMLSLNANGANAVSVTATDAAGNPASVSQSLVIDTTAPSITIATTALDNVINAAEHGAAVTLSGTTSGVEDGRAVTISLAGVNYTATVSGNTWTVIVPQGDVASLSDGTTYTVTVDVSDAAGNAAVQATQSLRVDMLAPTLAISTVAGDNILNAGERGSDLVISGTAAGAEDGQTVTVTLNGKSYTGSVANGSWSVTVRQADAAALTDGAAYQITVDGTDAAGNAATQAAGSLAVDLTLSGSLATLGALGVATLSNASNITVTGTSRDTTANDFAAIQTILSASNSGQTTFNALELSSAHAAALAVGSNDQITSLTLTNYASVVEASIVEALVSAHLVGTASYSVRDTAANIFDATVSSGTQAGYLAAINNAANVVVTDAVTAAQANTLFAATNSGTTTVNTVNANIAEAASLVLGSNDVLTNLNVSTGVQGPVVVDLRSNIPFTTNISVNGSSGTAAETVYVPAPTAANITANSATQTSAGTAVAGALSISGGSGNDVFVLTDAMSGGLPILTNYPSGVIDGGSGNDTLTVVGSIDISQLSIRNIESLVALPGSPSSVKLAAAQLAQFTSVTGTSAGANSTKIIISDEQVLTRITAPPMTGVDSVKIGVNVELIAPLSVVSSSTITTAVATQAGDRNGQLTIDASGNQHLTSDLHLDSSALAGISFNLTTLPSIKVDLATGQLVDTNTGFHVIMPTLANGQSITLTATQLGSYGMGSNPFSLAGSGKLVVVDDPNTSAIDLSGVTSGVSTALSLSGAKDLTSASSLVSTLGEIQLNGNNLTLGVNELTRNTPLAVGGIGNLTVSGSVASNTTPDLSQLSVKSGNTLDLTGITGGQVRLPAAVNSGETVLVNDNQFGGSTQTIANTGTLTISHTTPGSVTLDFSGVTTNSGGATVYDVAANATILSGSHLGSVAVTVESGKTLTVDANVASQATINGTGTLVVSGTLSAALDLSHLGTGLTSIDLTGVVLNGHTITLPAAIAQRQTVSVTAAELSGQTVSVAGALQLNLANATVSTLDLSHVTTSGTGTVNVNVTGNSTISAGNLGSTTIHVADGATLHVPMAVASGASIVADGSNQTGTVTLTGYPTSDGTLTGTPAAVDLHSITAPATWAVPTGAVTLPDGSRLGSVAVQIATANTQAGQSILSMSAATASGATIYNSGNGSLNGVLSLTGAYDKYVDLHLVQTDISLAATTMTTTASRIGFGLMPTLNGQNVTITATELLAVGGGSTAPLTLTGSGHLNVVKDAVTTGSLLINSAGTLDLSHIGPSVVPDFGTNHTISLARGSVLLLNPASADLVFGANAGNPVSVVTNTAQANGALPSVVLAGTLGTTNTNIAALGTGTAPTGGRPGLILDLSGLTDIVGYAGTPGSFTNAGTGSVSGLSLANGNVLIMAASQVAGTAPVIIGTGGTLDIRLSSGTSITATTDLSQISASIGLTFVGASGTTAVSIPVINNASLTLSSGQVTGRSFSSAQSQGADTGTVVVVYNANGTLGTAGAVNLSHVAANIDLASLGNLSVASNAFTDANGGTVTLPTLTAGQTLSVAVAQLAAGLPGFGTSTGATLEIRGDINQNLSLATLPDSFHVALTQGSGQNGSVVIGSQSPVTITIKAHQLSGVTLGSGVDGHGLDTGTIKLVYDSNQTVPSAVDLSHVSANIDFTGLTTLGVNASHQLQDGGAITLGTTSAAQTMTLTYAQAGTFANTVDFGQATAEIITIAGGTGVDLSNVVATGGHVIADVETAQTFTGNFGSAAVRVLNAVKLTTSASRVTGRSVYGFPSESSGTLVVTRDAGNVLAENLAFNSVRTAIDATALAGLVTVDAVTHNLTDGTHSVTFAGLVAGQKVFLNADQVVGANNAALALTHASNVSTSTLDIIGDFATNATVDLRSIQSGIRISFADSATDPSPSVRLDGASLAIKAGQIDGQTITSTTANGAATSTIALYDNDSGHLDQAVSLTHVTANIDLTNLAGLHTAHVAQGGDPSGSQFSDGTGSLTLGALTAAQTLTVYADQFGTLNSGDKAVISGAAGAHVVIGAGVAGGFTQNADISGIADTVATVLPSMVLVDSGQTLILKAAQAIDVAGNQVSSHAFGNLSPLVGNGTIALADNGTGYLSSLTDVTAVTTNIDLSRLVGLQVDSRASIGSLTDSHGLLLIPSLAAGQSLTVLGEQMKGAILAGTTQNAGLILSGAGTLNVTGNVAAGAGLAVNLTNVSASVAVHISGLYNAELQLTAAQVSGNAISTGSTGKIVVESLHANQGLTVTQLQGYLSGAHLPVTGDVVDTAANLVNAINANPTDLQAVLTSRGAKITATTPATAAQAAILAHSGLQVTYAIADTATALAGSSDAVLSAGTSVIATTPATVVEAVTLSGFATSHVAYSVNDSGANIADYIAAHPSDVALVDAALLGATGLVITGGTTFAQSVNLSALTAVSAFAETDTASHFTSALQGGSLAALTAKAASLVVTPDGGSAGTATQYETAAVASGSQTLSIAGTASGLAVGMTVTGQGIATGTTITAIAAASGGRTAITLSQAATYTAASETISFDVTGLSAATAETLATSNLIAGKYVDIQTVTTTVGDLEAALGTNVMSLPNGVRGITLTGTVVGANREVDTYATASTRPGNVSFANFSDTAGNVLAAWTGIISRVNGYITVTSGATVQQAIDLANLSRYTGKAILFSVYDTAANIAHLESYDGNYPVNWYPDLADFVTGSFTVSDSINGIQGAANAYDGARIATMMTRYSSAHVNFSVVDNLTNILGNFNNALLNKVTGSVVATGTVTAAQAVQLLGFTKSFTYSISDTIANIETALAQTHGNKTFLSHATNITVTDTVTVAQANDVIQAVTNSGTTSFAAMSDDAANVAGASSAVLAHVAGTVTATANGTTDLSQIQGNIDLTSVTGLGTDSSGHIRFSATSAIHGNQTTTTTYTATLPASMASGRTLYVTAAEIAGANGITLAGPGATINIANNIARSTSLLGVGSGVAVTFVDDTETGTGTAAIAAGAILQAFASQVSGKSLTGASNVSSQYGTVVIHGWTMQSGQLDVINGSGNAIDITHITANIDLASLNLSVNSDGVLADAHGNYILSSGSHGALVLQNNQSLTLTQTELLGGNQLAVGGAGAIDVKGDISNSLDLRYLATNPNVTLSFAEAADAQYNEAGTRGVVDVTGQGSAVTLTLTPTQANGLTVTGSNSTIHLTPGVTGTGLSGSVDLARVASTMPLTSTAWAGSLVNVNHNGSISANADGTVTITGTNINNDQTHFQFTASSYGVYTFNATAQGNSYGQNNYVFTGSYFGTNAVGYAPDRQNDFIAVYAPGMAWGGDVREGNTFNVTNFTTTLQPGQTVDFYIFNRDYRTSGINGGKTTADTLTLSINSAGSAGFSAYGGTSQTLTVDVAGSGSRSGSNITDLTTAVDPVAYTSVDSFALSNYAVLKMLPLQATNKQFTSADGTGSVLISGAFTGNNYFDLTTISVPVNFANNTISAYTDGNVFLNVEQVNGVFSSGQYWLYISNQIAANESIDLTQLGNGGRAYWRTFSGVPTGGSISTGDNFVLGNGAKLILTPDQINGQVVTNAANAQGTVYIVGDIGQGYGLNLLNIDPSVTISFQDGVQNVLVSPNNGSVTEGTLVTRTPDAVAAGSIAMGGSAALYVNGRSISGQTILGNGTNTVYVYNTLPEFGDTAPKADFSQITTSIDLENVVSQNTGGMAPLVADAQLGGNYVNLYMDLPTNPNSDQLLTLTGYEASNLHLEFGAGQVLVRNVQQLVSNGAISADFTQIHASQVSLYFEGGSAQDGNGIIRYSGNFGVDQVLMDRGTQIVMAGSIADGVIMNGRYDGGGIGIRGITANVDLTNTAHVSTLPLGNINNWVDISLAYADANSADLVGNALTFDNSSGQFEDSAGHHVTLPAFSGQTLEVTMDQLNGNAGSNTLIDVIAADRASGTGGLAGNGYIVIDGAITQNIDLTSWNSNFRVTFSGANDYFATFYREYGNYSQFNDTIAAGKTLTLRADQTYEGYLSGQGTVAVAGSFDTSWVYLGAVTANIDLTQLGGTTANVHVDGYGDYYDGTIGWKGGRSWIHDTTSNTWIVMDYNLAAGQTLSVLTDQLSGQAGLTLGGNNPGGGNPYASIVMTGNFDANTYQNTLNLTSIGANVQIKLNYDGVISHLDLGTSGTLDVRMDQAVGIAVTGTGTIVFYDGMNNLGSGLTAGVDHVDLSSVGANLDLTHVGELTLRSSVQGGGKLQYTNNGSYVVLPTLANGQSLNVNMGQLVGASTKLALSGVSGSAIVINGNLSSNVLDLTGIDSLVSVEINPSVNNNVVSSSLSIANGTLTIKAVHASGLSVLSPQQNSTLTGNVILQGPLVAATDLSSIVTNIDLTGISGLTVDASHEFADGVGTISNANWLLFGYQTLAVTAAQLGGGNALTLDGLAHSVIDIKGDTSSSINLSQIGDAVSISFADNVSNAIALSGNAVLTMKAIQASGQTITGAGSGTLVLVDNSLAVLGGAVDLSHVTSDIDLTGLAGVSWRAASSKFGDSSGTITLPTLISGETLWLSTSELTGATQASRPTIAGQTGSKLNITGDVTSGNVDISGVDSHIAVRFVDTSGYSRSVLVSSATLTVSAGQLAGGVNFTSGHDAQNAFTGTIAVKADTGANGHLASALNVAGVAANLDLTTLTHLTIDGQGVLVDQVDQTHTYSVTLPQLSAGQTLSLTADVLKTGQIGLSTSTGGTLSVVGNLTGNVDLSNLGDDVAVGLGNTASINGAYTLTAKSKAITGRAITTTTDPTSHAYLGTLAVADLSNHTLGGNLILTSVAANLDLTLLQNIVVNAQGVLVEQVNGQLTGSAITIGSLNAAQTLKIDANLLTGYAFALTGATGSKLDVEGNLTHAGTIDLTSVDAHVTIGFNGGTAIDLSNGGTLRLNSPLASGITVTSGDHQGTVQLVGALGGTVNLGSVSANIDMTGISGLTYGAYGSGQNAVTAFNDGTGSIANLSLVTGQVLTMTSAEVAGAPVVAGNGGTLIIVGNINAAMDLTGIASAISLNFVRPGGQPYQSVLNARLTLTAAQADIANSSAYFGESVTNSSGNTYTTFGTIVLAYVAGNLGQSVSLVRSGDGQNIDLSGLTGLTVNSQTGQFVDGAGHSITLPQFIYWQDLYVTAAQLTGGALSLGVNQYTGRYDHPRLNIAGDMAASVNLGGVDDHFAILFNGNATVGQLTLDGATLAIKAQQLVGHTVASGTAAGTVQVLDMSDHTLDGTLDLTSGTTVTANIDLTQLGGLVVDGINNLADTSGEILLPALASNQVLSVGIGQLDGVFHLSAAQGATGALLDIHDSSSQFGITADLSQLDSAIGIEFNGSHTGTLSLVNFSTLAVTAAQANGLRVSSDAQGTKTGQVRLVNGTLSATGTNLGNISAAIDLRPLTLSVGSMGGNSGVFTDGSGYITPLVLTAGQTLAVTSAQVAGATAVVIGSGSTSAAGTLDGGLVFVDGNITSATDLTGLDSHVGLTITGSLGNTTLTLHGAQASSVGLQALTPGQGTVVLKDVLVANTDLRGIHTNLDVTGMSGLTADVGVGNTLIDGSGHYLYLGDMNDPSQTVRITAAQADGLRTYEVGSNGFSTLILADDNGHSLNTNTNLGLVSTNIDLTQLSGLAVSNTHLTDQQTHFSLTLPALGTNQHLTVKAAELTGGALALGTAQGATGSRLVVSTDVANGQSVDLTSVDDAIGIAFSNNTASSTVRIDGNLTLTSVQANLLALGGSGAVTVNVTSATPAAFSLSNLATANATVDVSLSGAFDALTVLGGANVEVHVDGLSVALTTDAAVISGHRLWGSGTLVLTGSAVGSADLGGIYSGGNNGQVIATVDLTGVTAGTTDNGMIGASSIFHSGGGFATATIADGQAFVLTAAQLSGNALVAGGALHTGTAQVLHGDVVSAYDFSHQAAFNGLSLTFDTAGQMAAGTTGLSHFSIVNLATGTTSLSAAQADSVTWGGAGGVNVTHATGDASQHSLNGTAFADTFTGHGGNDLVDISQDSSVSDTLVFSGLAHDFSDVAGFTVTNFDQTTQTFDATGGDNLNFHALDGGNAFGFAHLDLANLPGKPSPMSPYPAIADHQVLVVDNFAAADATAVQVLFNSSLFHLNDRLVTGVAHDEILMISDGNNNANIWSWIDTSGDHKVQQSELHLLGTLHGLTINDGSDILGANDLSRLQSSHIIG
jgi:hypothetical protein